MRSALSNQCLADRAQPLAPAILPVHVVRGAVGDARPSLDAKVANLLGLGLGLGLERGFPSVVEHQSPVRSAAVSCQNLVRLLDDGVVLPSRIMMDARITSAHDSAGSAFIDRCADISTPGRRAC